MELYGSDSYTENVIVQSFINYILLCLYRDTCINSTYAPESVL